MTTLLAIMVLPTLLFVLYIAVALSSPVKKEKVGMPNEKRDPNWIIFNLIPDDGPKLDYNAVMDASEAGEGPKLMLWKQVIERLWYAEQALHQMRRLQRIRKEGK